MKRPPRRSSANLTLWGEVNLDVLSKARAQPRTKVRHHHGIVAPTLCRILQGRFSPWSSQPTV
eukprot:363150-Hanusia_phi.AAC.1